MKLRFFMSHGRNNSARDKVVGKKWVYLERYTPIDRMQSTSKTENDLWRKHTPQAEYRPSQMRDPKFGVVSFYRLDNFIG